MIQAEDGGDSVNEDDEPDEVEFASDDEKGPMTRGRAKRRKDEEDFSIENEDEDEEDEPGIDECEPEVISDTESTKAARKKS